MGMDVYGCNTAIQMYRIVNQKQLRKMQKTRLEQASLEVVSLKECILMFAARNSSSQAPSGL